MQSPPFSLFASTFFVAAFCLFASSATAQTVQATPAATTFPAEGFVYEDNNRGYLENVKITVKDENGTIVEDTYTDVTGKFVASLAPEHIYKVRVEKRAFYSLDTTINTQAHPLGTALYVKYPLKRLPGYIFDATISDLLSEQEKAEGKYASSVDSVRVEIYNTTKKEEALVYNTGDTHLFNFTFEQGNHYTMLLRRRGFFAKRIEANINIHGCILCFEGLGNVTPGVVDNLTEKNTAGTLGANIQMRKIELNKALKIENIYYDVSRWEIRPEAAKELDKLVAILKDNPRLIIELGSHTDARGSAEDNMVLSQKRAESAVQYIVSKGVSNERIAAKGYGEEKILNACTDGVNCSEPEHQRNRRTEFTVTGIMREDPYETKSLREIIEEQAFMDMIMKGDVETIQVGADGKIPENLKKDIDKQQKRADELNKKPEPIVQAPAPNPVTITSKTEPKTAPVVEKTAQQPSAAVPTSAFKPLPANYTGFRVQLLVNKNEALPPNHPLAFEFSTVFEEESSPKNYAYLIGDYANIAAANKMLQQVVGNYEFAKVVRYKNGKRVL
jgi:outer membrane protein OmpA-like peptidoglycan-associated protein